MSNDKSSTTPQNRFATSLAGWHGDPSGKHQYRYWDGHRWTEHVATDGTQSVAPLDPKPDEQATSAAAAPSPLDVLGDRAARDARIPLFGARGRAQELAKEVDRLQAQLTRLGALPVIELERRRDALQAEVTAQAQRLEHERQAATAGIAAEQAAAREAVQREVAAAAQERIRLTAEMRELQAQVVTTADEAMLQEAGIYEYRHPLTDAVAYQAELSRLRDLTKRMNRKDGGAVLGTTDWTVNGSAAQGRKMVRETSKLMLRAYNAEADNLVRGLQPYKLVSAIDRLSKVVQTIARLGQTMNVEIAGDYHRLRVKELELTADYLEKVAEEKEREREEKARLREERKAQQEMERERARLEKERQHHANALEALLAKGDEEAAARLREQLAEVDKRIEDVDYRAANIRAGYVYVISNVGSFGARVVKIGMTRRLEPQDRVRELGDASVPFRFDTHTLFFSNDAVGIEAELHRRLADRRINRVNMRREFFEATPAEVKAHLAELSGEILEYTELPEALEYHQSVTERGRQSES